VDDRAENGATAAYLAAQEGHADVLRHLVEDRGADASIPAADGMQPAHAAAQNGCLKCLAFLVSLS